MGNGAVVCGWQKNFIVKREKMELDCGSDGHGTIDVPLPKLEWPFGCNWII